VSQQKRILALGFFDGVHIGHGALLNRCAALAQETGLSPAAFTFDQMPREFLTGQTIPLINTAAEREYLIHRYYGIKQVLVHPLSRAFLSLHWKDYVTHFLMKQLGAAQLVAGFDHTFGAKGEGTAAKLQSLCAELGIGCDIIPPVSLDGEPVSSTRIRTLMESGAFDRAVALLGHPHVIRGTVTRGQSVGRTLGFPTVNLLPDVHSVRLPLGVYAAEVTVDGVNHPAVTNVGTRPTFYNDDSVHLESFLLDFQGELYGKTITLALHKFLRPERRFPSSRALQEEIRSNIQQVQQYFQV